jgi:hypothetical protein
MIGTNVLFTFDRFGLPNSALQFQASNFLSVPTGFYLSGPFTITVWVYLNSYSTLNSNPRVLDFGNGAMLQNIFIAFSSNTGVVIFSMVHSISNIYYECKTTDRVPLFKWTHLAVQYDGNTKTFIYIDGILKASCNNADTMSGAHVNVRTINNYIGKSNWASDALLNGALDELKIYKRVLKQSELEWDMISFFMTTMPLDLPNINEISK